VAASAISRRVGAPLMTRHFTLSEAMKAYDTFGNAMRERALKIIITND
jgi:alcohol dehydrogenase